MNWVLSAILGQVKWWSTNDGNTDTNVGDGSTGGTKVVENTSSNLLNDLSWTWVLEKFIKSAWEFQFIVEKYNKLKSRYNNLERRWVNICNSLDSRLSSEEREILSIDRDLYNFEPIINSYKESLGDLFSTLTLIELLSFLMSDKWKEIKFYELNWDWRYIRLDFLDLLEKYKKDNKTYNKTYQDVVKEFYEIIITNGMDVIDYKFLDEFISIDGFHDIKKELIRDCYFNNIKTLFIKISDVVKIFNRYSIEFTDEQKRLIRKEILLYYTNKNIDLESLKALWVNISESDLNSVRMKKILEEEKKKYNYLVSELSRKIEHTFKVLKDILSSINEANSKFEESMFSNEQLWTREWFSLYKGKDFNLDKPSIMQTKMVKFLNKYLNGDNTIVNNWDIFNPKKWLFLYALPWRWKTHLIMVFVLELIKKYNRNLLDRFDKFIDNNVNGFKSLFLEDSDSMEALFNFKSNVGEEQLQSSNKEKDRNTEDTEEELNFEDSSFYEKELEKFTKAVEQLNKKFEVFNAECKQYEKELKELPNLESLILVLHNNDIVKILKDSKEREALLDQASKVPILIIDELFIDGKVSEYSTFFKELLERRYHNNLFWLFVTSNMEPKATLSWIDKSRIEMVFSRLNEMTLLASLNDQEVDYRQKGNSSLLESL